MLKRLAPTLAVLFSFLLDTAVLPVFMYGRYLVPLSLITVILIGITLRRMSGLLYGTIAGLLVDISTGTLGMKLFPYMLIGFLIGFLLDQQPEISRSLERRERLQLIAVHAIWIFVLVLLYEIFLFVFQYFNTAIFEWKYVLDLLLRTALVTVLSLLLMPLSRRVFLKRAVHSGRNRVTREVKHF